MSLQEVGRLALGIVCGIGLVLLARWIWDARPRPRCLDCNLAIVRGDRCTPCSEEYR